MWIIMTLLCQWRPFNDRLLIVSLLIMLSLGLGFRVNKIKKLAISRTTARDSHWHWHNRPKPKTLGCSTCSRWSNVVGWKRLRWTMWFSWTSSLPKIGISNVLELWLMYSRWLACYSELAFLLCSALFSQDTSSLCWLLSIRLLLSLSSCWGSYLGLKDELPFSVEASSFRYFFSLMMLYRLYHTLRLLMLQFNLSSLRK